MNRILLLFLLLLVSGECLIGQDSGEGNTAPIPIREEEGYILNVLEAYSPEVIFEGLAEDAKRYRKYFILLAMIPLIYGLSREIVTAQGSTISGQNTMGQIYRAINKYAFLIVCIATIPFLANKMDELQYVVTSEINQDVTGIANNQVPTTFALITRVYRFADTSLTAMATQMFNFDIGREQIEAELEENNGATIHEILIQHERPEDVTSEDYQELFIQSMETLRDDASRALGGYFTTDSDGNDLQRIEYVINEQIGDPPVDLHVGRVESVSNRGRATERNTGIYLVWREEGVEFEQVRNTDNDRIRLISSRTIPIIIEDLDEFNEEQGWLRRLINGIERGIEHGLTIVVNILSAIVKGIFVLLFLVIIMLCFLFAGLVQWGIMIMRYFLIHAESIILPFFIAAIAIPSLRSGATNFILKYSLMIWWPLGWALGHWGSVKLFDATVNILTRRSDMTTLAIDAIRGNIQGNPLTPEQRDVYGFELMHAISAEAILLFFVFGLFTCCWIVIVAFGAPWMLSKALTGSGSFFGAGAGAAAQATGNVGSEAIQLGTAMATGGSSAVAGAAAKGASGAAGGGAPGSSGGDGGGGSDDGGGSGSGGDGGGSDSPSPASTASNMKTGSPALKSWAKQGGLGAAKTLKNLSRFSGDPSSLAGALDLGTDERRQFNQQSANQGQARTNEQIVQGIGETNKHMGDLLKEMKTLNKDK